MSNSLAGHFKLSILILSMIICIKQDGICQTSLQGSVIEKSNDTPIPFATVALIKNGNTITGADTDFDGNYFLYDIDPGIYDLEFSFIGFKTYTAFEVEVIKGIVNEKSVSMREEPLDPSHIVTFGCFKHNPPIIEFDNFTSGTIINNGDIRMKQFRSSR